VLYGSQKNVAWICRVQSVHTLQRRQIHYNKMNRSPLLLVATLLSVSAFAPSSDRRLAARSPSKTTIRRFLQEDEPTNTLEPEEKKQQQDDEEPVYFNILSETTKTGSSSVMDAVVATNSGAAASSSNSNSLPAINGWVPKPDYALWGLPGAIAPTGYFDPLGFAREGLPLNDAKRLREAEVQHGRVAMMATVGYWVGEAELPWGAARGPANDQLQQVPAPAFAILTLAIAAAEIYRAQRGWVEPQFRIGSNTLFTLRDSYYPGDLGFDPLGLKPTENYAFQRMQTKELSNGRLAMLGWAGMCAQELVNHKTIGDTLDFYQTVYSGGNPYY